MYTFRGIGVQYFSSLSPPVTEEEESKGSPETIEVVKGKETASHRSRKRKRVSIKPAEEESITTVLTEPPVDNALPQASAYIKVKKYKLTKPIMQVSSPLSESDDVKKYKITKLDLEKFKQIFGIKSADSGNSSSGVECPEIVEEEHIYTTALWTSHAGDMDTFGTDGVLRFYHEDENDREFTNTFPCPIQVGDHKYLSVEHCVQCQKYGGPEDELGELLVGENPTAGLDPLEAREYMDENHRDESIPEHCWLMCCNRVMREALREKFNFHNYPNLAVKLMMTLPQYPILAENSPRDDFWGVGYKKEHKECKKEFQKHKKNHNKCKKYHRGCGQNRLGLLLMERRSVLREQWCQMNAREQRYLKRTVPTIKCDEYVKNASYIEDAHLKIPEYGLSVCERSDLEDLKDKSKKSRDLVVPPLIEKSERPGKRSTIRNKPPAPTTDRHRRK